MPNEHGQITKEDFKAPEGQFRVMKEDMSDGDLEIIADFYRENIAMDYVTLLREGNEEDVFTLWDDKGEEVI